MPKTNLCKPREDPRKAEVRAILCAGMARQGINRQTLSKKTKIPYSTISYRLQNPETIKLDELWIMLDTLKVSEEERERLV